MPPVVLPNLADKQVRETRLHFLDARINPNTGTPLIVLVGDDNEELSRESGWNIESTKVVTGRVAVSATRSEMTMTVDPYFIREGEPLGLLLQHIDENRLELDEVRRWYYEVKLDKDDEVIYAFKELCWVTSDSVGGAATDGDAIPFTLTFDNNPIKQYFRQNATTLVFEFSDAPFGP